MAPSLGEIRRWAANHGFTLMRVTENQADKLDVLAELGGSGTAYDIACHTGEKKISHVHKRMKDMMRLGAVERSGDGKNGRPFTYSLTPVGEILRCKV